MNFDGSPPATGADKKAPFDIDQVITLLREAVAPYPSATLFALAEEGYNALFEVLVSCILSIRTRDEEHIIVARRFLSQTRTPEAVAALSVEEIVNRIDGTTYPEPKAAQIRQIDEYAVQHGGLPNSYEALLDLPGVGPKCANLSLGIAHGPAAAPHVGVDVHVHRVTNRWGYVQAKTPEKTMEKLDTILPTRYRLEINRLLVPFGKHICTGTLPRCSSCPVLPMCQQAGVDKHR